MSLHTYMVLITSLLSPSVSSLLCITLLPPVAHSPPISSYIKTPASSNERIRITCAEKCPCGLAHLGGEKASVSIPTTTFSCSICVTHFKSSG